MMVVWMHLGPPGYDSYYVDFVTICTKYGVLPLLADFRTKERRLLMAHKLRPPTEA